MQGNTPIHAWCAEILITGWIITYLACIRMFSTVDQSVLLNWHFPSNTNSIAQGNTPTHANPENRNQNQLVNISAIAYNQCTLIGPKICMLCTGLHAPAIRRSAPRIAKIRECRNLLLLCRGSEIKFVVFRVKKCSIGRTKHLNFYPFWSLDFIRPGDAGALKFIRPSWQNRRNYA